MRSTFKILPYINRKRIKSDGTTAVLCRVSIDGKSTLLLTVLSFNVGQGVLLGHGGHPKSKLIRKLEAGNRDIYREYIAYCRYKGKQHAMLFNRRKTEFALLYIP